MTGYFTAPRMLQPGDAAPARTLIRSALGGTPYIGRVLELLDVAERGDPECRSLVIERDATVAALALFGAVAGARGVWKLHTVLVDPRVPLRDAGSSMIEALVEQMCAMGARMMVAELPADQPYGDTLSLLRASDFDQEGRITDYFRDGVALLFLRRDL